MPVLTAVSCSSDAYISCGIVTIGMVFTIFVLQLLVYSELYRNNRSCMPILYFFGERGGCQQTITRIAQNANLHGKAQRDMKKMTFAESFEAQSRNIHDSFTGYITWLYDIFSRFNMNMTKTIEQVKEFEGTYYKEVIRPSLM